MANYENIKDANFNRTPRERRELAKKAGMASGKARQKNANFRKTLNKLLTTEIDSLEWKPLLEMLEIDCTLESAMLMAMIKEAMQGNVKAAYFVAQYAGQSGLSDEDIQNKQADTELKQAKKQAVTGENETDEALNKLDQILKEVRDNAIKQETE